MPLILEYLASTVWAHIPQGWEKYQKHRHRSTGHTLKPCAPHLSAKRNPFHLLKKTLLLSQIFTLFSYSFHLQTTHSLFLITPRIHVKNENGPLKFRKSGSGLIRSFIGTIGNPHLCQVKTVLEMNISGAV